MLPINVTPNICMFACCCFVLLWAVKSFFLHHSAQRGNNNREQIQFAKCLTSASDASICHVLNLDVRAVRSN